MSTDLTAPFTLILQNPSHFAIVILYLGILLLIAEILSRYHKTDSELTRKIVHIGTGNVILLAWWLNISKDVILLASVVASFIAIMSYFLPILPSVNGVGRNSLGTLFYAISIGILTALFWQNGQRQFTAIGILIMSYGDGMAALIGQKWGKHKYQILGNQKSWEGSLTMTGVSILVTVIILGFTWQNLLIASIVGIFATILETFSSIGIDNLTVPVASGIIVYYLS
ncbi:diacylglycerol/polyprenol kinase family protein [Geminocystis sp. NIES-3709]|uniref:diacylglycerol/polyprenol kinase family protein n=1 Tax=Geminocystis sp. NIES-3709 TaxID=1617448 RepID=UPI0005FC6E5C|nr:diacylglycerol/polyprenol kinase family protein [Geminocystis sp. NIES-3709]BAQ63268.1 phytol kinase [Geminocystis sp. NIES-3709]